MNNFIKRDKELRYLQSNQLRHTMPRYKLYHWLVVVYISTAYIIALPVSSFIVLWRKQRAMIATMYRDELRSLGSGMEMISGLHFLYENHEKRTWHWEVVETSHKVILTSGLILVGEESRSYIGLAWVIAGMYGMLFSWMKPIQDTSENRLMATSLAVTVFNLGVGAVSRIPVENINIHRHKHGRPLIQDFNI